MRRFKFIFLIALVGFFACGKDDTDPTDPTTTNPTGGTTDENSSVLWEKNLVADFKSDIAVDDNDNFYFLGESDNYYLFSYDKDGNENWKVSLNSLSTNSNHLMIGDNKIYVGIFSNLQCYNLDGTLNWEINLPINCDDMAYSNGKLYCIGYSIINNEATLLAYSSSGTETWNMQFYKYQNSSISTFQDNICVSSKNTDVYPNTIGVTMVKDNGSSGLVQWDSFYQKTGNYANAYSVSFDNTNVYYEESHNDTTYIHAFDISSGTEKWSKTLSNYPVFNPVILTGGGSVVATFLDNSDDGSVNSLSVLDAATGNITGTMEDILTENQLFLTANNNIICFDYVSTDNQGPTIHEVSSQGSIVKDFDGSIFGSLMSFDACQVLSTGSLIILDDKNIICSKTKTNYILAGTGSWNSANGNIYNNKSVY